MKPKKTVTTVGDLIKKLQSIKNKEMYVMLYGHGGGIKDVTEVKNVNVMLNVNFDSEKWVGPHGVAQKGGLEVLILN